MRYTQILPSVLIAIDVGAALVYAFAHDFKHALYWLSAATLTATVTF